MNQPTDPKIQIFLTELAIADNEMFDLITNIRKTVFNSLRETEEKLMYGGIVFFCDNQMFSGVFANKKHVSFEFSKGFLMKDPNLHLEGKGKFRRHLKINNMDDIVIKELAHFVLQAIELQKIV